MTKLLLKNRTLQKWIRSRDNQKKLFSKESEIFLRFHISVICRIESMIRCCAAVRIDMPIDVYLFPYYIWCIVQWNSIRQSIVQNSERLMPIWMKWRLYRSSRSYLSPQICTDLRIHFASLVYRNDAFWYKSCLKYSILQNFSLAINFELYNT